MGRVYTSRRVSGGLATLTEPWQLPGAACWFEADTGVTGTTTITAWADTRTSSGLIFLPDAASPSLVAAAYNGSPTARFVAASSQSMSIAATDLVGSGAYSMYVVVKLITGFINAPIAGNWTAGGGTGFYANGANLSVRHPGSADHDDAAVTANLECWAATRGAGLAPLLWRNGVAAAIGTTATMVAAGGAGKVCVGQGNGNAGFLNGDLAAFGLFSLQHMTSQRAAVEAYLMRKYGVT